MLPGRGTTFIREVSGPPDAADRPTLMLLHGLTANADLNWFTCFEALGQHFRVVALDQRGHGRGIPADRHFRLADCADDVLALSNMLGLDRIIAVGYSMGGPIAQLTWHRHPELVAGLVLCATARNFTGTPLQRLATASFLPAFAALARITPDSVRQRVVDRALANRTAESPRAAWAISEFRRNDPAALAGAAAALGRFTSRDWIAKVDVPTAVVVTTRDHIVPPHRQVKLADAIPGATIIEVHGDHDVVAAQPQLFVPALVTACRLVADEGTRLTP